LGVAIYAPPLAAAEPTPRFTPEDVLHTSLVRSPSGRFSIAGANSAEVLDLMQWADALASRVEATLGRKMPFEKRLIRISILPCASNQVASVDAREGYDGPTLIQWLRITGYDTAPVALVQESLVRLLVSGFLPDRRPLADATRLSGVVPDWFVSAVIHNLNAESRDRAYQQVFDAWRNGALPSLREGMDRQGTPRVLPEDAPLSAVLLQWILSLSDAGACMDRLWLRFQEEKPFTAADLIPFVPRGGSATDLDRAWDDWLLKERNRIRLPGQPSAHALEQLKAQLLIYPDDSATGMSGEARQPFAPRDLVGSRKAAWVPAAASSKAMRLRLLGIGRDEGFRDVVDAYISFLDALTERRSTRVLMQRLETAERKLSDYESRSATHESLEPGSRKETR
jgi:hypothetical protein